MSPAKRKPKPEPDSIAHRRYGVSDDHADWCRVVVNFDDRHDSVQSVNGVEVGQFWRNIYVGKVERVYEIRLAGMGTHSAHYESIVLCPEGQEPEGMFDVSGQSLVTIRNCWECVEQLDGEWVRVEPQPFVWEDFGDPREAREKGTYRSERALVCRVRHDRPEGESLDWIGQNGTSWRLYRSGVVTCDGLVLSGQGKRYESLLKLFPFAKPRVRSLQKALPIAMSNY